jgi:hypothetical protein
MASAYVKNLSTGRHEKMKTGKGGDGFAGRVSAKLRI